MNIDLLVLNRIVVLNSNFDMFFSEPSTRITAVCLAGLGIASFGAGVALKLINRNLDDENKKDDGDIK